jgi:hypothetical protein
MTYDCISNGAKSKIEFHAHFYDIIFGMDIGNHGSEIQYMHKWSPIHLEYRFFHGGNSFLTSIPVFM